MTPGDSPALNAKRNGTDRKASSRSKVEEVSAADSQALHSADAPVVIDATCDAANPEKAVRHIYAPTIDEIKSELWWIATGEGTESSRVSALRALADIMGLMKPISPEFPEGMTALLDALAEGLGTRP